MRIMVLGACGMLGRDVVRILYHRSEYNLIDVTALCHTECDITSTVDVLKAFETHQPNVVINCAAYTDVDGAEVDPQRAHMVNGYGPWNIVNALHGLSIPLIHLSSDYVLPGSRDPRRGGYRSDFDTLGNRPINAYGRSKRDGELAVLSYEQGYVVRSSWLYGDGKCFPRTMLQLAQTRDTINVVNDQWGCPTSTSDLANMLAEFTLHIDHSEIYEGVYHFTSPDFCTWYDLARETFRLAGLDFTRIRAVSSTEFPRPAVRPRNSILTPSRMSDVGLMQLPDWRRQLQSAFDAGTFSKITTNEDRE